MDSFDFEWMTSNLSISYPFMDKVLGTPVTSEPEIEIHKLIADARLSYRYSAPVTITITSFVLTQSVAPYGISFGLRESTLGNLVVTNDETITETVFGDWIVVKQPFTSTNAPNILDSIPLRGELVVLLNKTAIEAIGAVGTYSWTFEAGFVPRCYEQLSPRITSIRIWPDADGFGRQGCTQVSPQGLILSEGFNISLKRDVDTTFLPFPFETKQTVRPPTVLQIEASPGLGRGRKVPDCDSAGALRKINGVVPAADGNLLIKTDSCIRFRKKTAAEAAGDTPGLMYFHDCEPCCECQDYVNVYEAIRNQAEAGTSLQTRLDAINTSLSDMYAKWNAQARVVKQLLRIYPRSGWVMAIQGIAFNATTQTINNPSFIFDIIHPVTPRLVTNSGYFTTNANKNVPSDPSVHQKRYTFNMMPYTFDTGTLLVYTFEIYFPEHASRVAGSEVNVKMTLKFSNYGPAEGTISYATERLKGHTNY